MENTSGTPMNEMSMRELAKRLIEQRTGWERVQGGVLPAQLQELSATWWINSAPELRGQGIPDMLRGIAEAIEEQDDDPREIAAALISFAFYLGATHVFDAYQAASDALDLALEQGAVIGA